MNYPLSKYRYYTDGKQVIAVSTYGGKTVRGVAKCAPSDNFNMEIGKQIAAARCNEKVAIKRYNRATQKYEEALETLRIAEAHVNDMRRYLNDAFIAKNEAAVSHDMLIKNLAKMS